MKIQQKVYLFETRQLLGKDQPSQFDFIHTIIIISIYLLLYKYKIAPRHQKTCHHVATNERQENASF